MNEDLAAGLCILAFISCVMLFLYWLSTRETQDAVRGETRTQRRDKVRYGVFYADSDDPRVWVPRPLGNGWDPNLATTGGKAVWAGLLVVPLVVVATAVATR